MIASFQLYYLLMLTVLQLGYLRNEVGLLLMMFLEKIKMMMMQKLWGWPDAADVATSLKDVAAELHKLVSSAASYQTLFYATVEILT